MEEHTQLTDYSSKNVEIPEDAFSQQPKERSFTLCIIKCIFDLPFFLVLFLA